MIRTIQSFSTRCVAAVTRTSVLNLLAPQKSRGAVIKAVACAAALVLFAHTPATAAQIYDFTFIGSDGMNATGTITIDAGQAQLGSINVTGVPVELDPSTLVTASGALLPGNGSPQNRNGDNLPYDNLVNFANNPILTGNGLDFASGQYDPTHYDTLIGLWGGDINGNPVANEYTLFVGLASFHQDGSVDNNEYVYTSTPGSLNLTPVPEPSTCALVASALLVGVGVLRRRRAN